MGTPFRASQLRQEWVADAGCSGAPSKCRTLECSPPRIGTRRTLSRWDCCNRSSRTSLRCMPHFRCSRPRIPSESWEPVMLSIVSCAHSPTQSVRSWIIFGVQVPLDAQTTTIAAKCHSPRAGPCRLHQRRSRWRSPRPPRSHYCSRRRRLCTSGPRIPLDLRR